jgi:AraC-like DNA-binding protein
MIEISNSDVIANQCQELATLVMRHTEGNGVHPTAIARLSFARSNAMSTATYSVGEPYLAIIVQGKKEVLLGEETYPYHPGQYLVLSVALPIGGGVVEATPDKPCLVLKLSLDLAQLCDLVAQMSFSAAQPKNSMRGLWVSNVDATSIECVLRLVKLLETPRDIPILAPMMLRELYYRLLLGEQSEAVMSPLQYQKQLRLMEARRLMLTEDFDAIAAASRVGYESPSQFSREYSRMFGAPPKRDIERLRTT